MSIQHHKGTMKKVILEEDQTLEDYAMAEMQRRHIKLKTRNQYDSYLECLIFETRESFYFHEKTGDLYVRENKCYDHGEAIATIEVDGDVLTYELKFNDNCDNTNTFLDYAMEEAGL